MLCCLNLAVTSDNLRDLQSCMILTSFTSHDPNEYTSPSSPLNTTGSWTPTVVDTNRQSFSCSLCGQYACIADTLVEKNPCRSNWYLLSTEISYNCVWSPFYCKTHSYILWYSCSLPNRLVNLHNNLTTHIDISVGINSSKYFHQSRKIRDIATCSYKTSLCKSNGIAVS